MNEVSRKKELLEHYAKGDVHRFLQLDGWTNVGDGDDVMRPDEDGDHIMFGGAEELRHSGKDLAVRVFIHEGTEHKVAIRLLKKLLMTLEAGGILLDIIGNLNTRVATRYVDEGEAK